MRAILMSIKPKWVAKILNGEKTIEIRKTIPKCDLPIDVYIYCTKEDNLFKSYIRMGYYTTRSTADDLSYNGKGKVVAKFTLNKITTTYHFCEEEICSLSGLSDDELFNYLGHSDGYAWHISNLVIFDEPKHLCDFWNTKKGVFCCPLTKAPQSWQFIESEE